MSTTSGRNHSLLESVPWSLLVLFASIAVASAYAQTAPSIGPAPILTFTPGLANTLAGVGTAGYSGDGGPASQAQFNSPIGIARDAQGNLYIADIGNDVVRKISVGGTVTTVAGNGTQGYSGDGGPAINAQLGYPIAVALDDFGNLFIADFVNSCIRKVDVNGIISTIATGSGAPVRGVSTDLAGNLYFSSSLEGVWKVDPTGVTTKIVGNGTPGFSGDGGPATDAQTSGVNGITLDKQGNLYLTESFNSDVRKVDVNGIITTFAGDHQFGFAGDGGPATNARFNSPTDVRVDDGGNVYVADSANNRIRKINALGIIRTVAGDGNFAYAGDGGLATQAQFAGPAAVGLDDVGNLLIADTGNNVIRKIQTTSTTLDFGTVPVGQMAGPNVVIVSNAGNADLHIPDVSASASFSTQTTCPAASPLPPGSECTIDVSFAPLLAGNVTGAVTVNDDAPGNPHFIYLKGRGQIVPVASQLVFATQFQVMPLNGNLGSLAVNATDANANLVTSFNGPVDLQLTGPSGFTTFVTQLNAVNGIATFNLSAVILDAVGSYTITASAPGLTSAQGAFSVTGNPDFVVSTSATSMTVGQTGAGTITALVSPINGFMGTISLSCSGLPSHSTCSFGPPTLPADGSNRVLQSVVTISTGVKTAGADLPQTEMALFLATGAGSLSTGLFGLALYSFRYRTPDKRDQRRLRSLLMPIVIICCSGLIGCGAVAPVSSQRTPSGKYTVTITCTSIAQSHRATFSLLVQ